MELGLAGREKYQWTEDELGALKERQLARSGPTGFDRHWVVWNLKHEDGSMYVGKVVANHSMELQAIRKMIQSPSSKNHTIPADIITCARTSIIVMPYLQTVSSIHWGRRNERIMFDILDKILEGVEFMHESNMAFVDIAESNLVTTFTTVKTPLFDVSVGSLYFIDFGSARLFASGPGSGVVVKDWSDAGGHYDPPEGEDALEPFAYDIYCLGQTISDICEIAIGRNPNIRIPGCVQHYTSWLSHADPRCRPSIWKACRTWHLLRVWISGTRWLYNILHEAYADSLITSGWRILSWLII